MTTMLMPILAALALLGPQPPMPTAAINAAKDARAKVETAQQKNAEALVPQPPAGLLPPPRGGAGQPPAGQPAAPAPPPSGQAPAPGASTALPPTEGSYTYDPQGRRDPFVSLLNRGETLRPMGGMRPPGLPGLLIGEIAVKGIYKAKSGFVAIVQGADSKTYIAHPGDRVLDGTIKSIAQDAIVFSQDVNDPLSTVKQREVRKPIRPDGQ
jgi:hypothetical protein